MLFLLCYLLPFYIWQMKKIADNIFTKEEIDQEIKNRIFLFLSEQQKELLSNLIQHPPMPLVGSGVSIKITIQRLGETIY